MKILLDYDNTCTRFDKTYNIRYAHSYIYLDRTNKKIFLNSFKKMFLLKICEKGIIFEF